MLLTDEEIIAAGYKSGDPDGLLQFGRNLEAAILENLASAELPEPAGRVMAEHNGFVRGRLYRIEDRVDGKPLYTADQLRQAYAQGAASQLATCKNCLQVELLLKDMLDTLPYNTPEYWIERIRGALSPYTRRQAND